MIYNVYMCCTAYMPINGMILILVGLGPDCSLKSIKLDMFKLNVFYQFLNYVYYITICTSKLQDKEWDQFPVLYKFPWCVDAFRLSSFPNIKNSVS